MSRRPLPAHFILPFIYLKKWKRRLHLSLWTVQTAPPAAPLFRRYCVGTARRLIALWLARSAQIFRGWKLNPQIVMSSDCLRNAHDTGLWGAFRARLDHRYFSVRHWQNVGVFLYQWGRCFIPHSLSLWASQRSINLLFISLKGFTLQIQGFF